MYYCFILEFGCIGIFIFMMIVVGLNFWGKYGVFIFLFLENKCGFLVIFNIKISFIL